MSAEDAEEPVPSSPPLPSHPPTAARVGVSSRKKSSTLATPAEYRRQHRRMQTADTIRQAKEAMEARRESSTMVEMDTSVLLEKLSRGVSGELSPTIAAKDRELRGEMSLKRMKAELEEMREDNSQATQIIGTLVTELDDAKAENLELADEIQRQDLEMRALEEKLLLMEDMYVAEREQHELTAQALEEMHLEMSEKEQLFQEQKRQEEADKRQSEQISAVMKPRDFDSFDAEVTATMLKTPTERKLFGELTEERHRNDELQADVEAMGERLVELTNISLDYEELKQTHEDYVQNSEQSMDMTNSRYEAMTHEIVQLAARNAALDKDQYEMVGELEERDYQVQMLKTHLEFAGVSLPDGLDAFAADSDMFEGSVVHHSATGTQIQGGEGGYMSIAALAPEESYMYSDEDDIEDADSYSDEDFKDEASKTVETRGKSKKKKKKQVDVPDVVREYLHLTATVVKMKYPFVQLDSAQLLESVKHKQFWEYYDHMELRMIHESAKMKREQRDAAKAAGGARKRTPSKPSKHKHSFWTKLGTRMGVFSDESSSRKRSAASGKKATATESVEGEALASVPKKKKLLSTIHYRSVKRRGSRKGTKIKPKRRKSIGVSTAAKLKKSAMAQLSRSVPKAAASDRLATAEFKAVSELPPEYDEVASATAVLSTAMVVDMSSAQPPPTLESTMD